jgi:hypothetical protein
MVPGLGPGSSRTVITQDPDIFRNRYNLRFFRILSGRLTGSRNSRKNKEYGEEENKQFQHIFHGNASFWGQGYGSNNTLKHLDAERMETVSPLAEHRFGK